MFVKIPTSEKEFFVRLQSIRVVNDERGLFIYHKMKAMATNIQRSEVSREKTRKEAPRTF